MTIAVKQHYVFEVISDKGVLAEGTHLQVLGTRDLCPGASLVIRPNFHGPEDSWSGRVVALEDSGAIALIEIENEHVRLRRGTTINAGGAGDIPRRPWVVDSVGRR